MTISEKDFGKYLFLTANSLYYIELDYNYYSSIKEQKIKKIAGMDFFIFSIVI